MFQKYGVSAFSRTHEVCLKADTTYIWKPV